MFKSSHRKKWNMYPNFKYVYIKYLHIKNTCMCIFYASMYIQNIYHEIQLFCFLPPNVIYTGIHL